MLHYSGAVKYSEITESFFHDSQKRMLAYFWWRLCKCLENCFLIRKWSCMHMPMLLNCWIKPCSCKEFILQICIMYCSIQIMDNNVRFRLIRQLPFFWQYERTMRMTLANSWLCWRTSKSSQILHLSAYCMFHLKA